MFIPAAICTHPRTHHPGGYSFWKSRDSAIIAIGETDVKGNPVRIMGVRGYVHVQRRDRTPYNFLKLAHNESFIRLVI